LDSQTTTSVPLLRRAIEARCCALLTAVLTRNSGPTLESTFIVTVEVLAAKVVEPA